MDCSSDTSGIGDGGCDDIFDCEETDYDGGDCVDSEPEPGADCTTSWGSEGIYTCDLECSSYTTWIGDDYCDSIFNCEETDWDGGDCSTDPEPIATPGDDCTTSWGGEGIYTCDLECSSYTTWIGDDYCDEIFNCEETDWDGGDCLDDVTLGVSSDAGDAVLDFQCAEWDGTLCTQPQVRIPDGECDAHAYSGMWADTAYFNSPTTRICPSFCKGMTGDDSYETCEAGTGEVSSFIGYGWSIGTGPFLGSECSEDTYRWWTETPGYTETWTRTITISDSVGSNPQLHVECSAW
jgi:hypothetical protein